MQKHLKREVPHSSEEDWYSINLPEQEARAALAEVRRAMNAEDVSYQFAELGKVDLGGGGTIAYIMANYGMEVIDSGVAVLSMHAPWEVTSKADVYEAYRGYKSFLRNI